MSSTSPRAWLLPPLLGLGHGLSDCAAGFLIAELSSGELNYNTGFYIVLYNLIAFAGQVPVGMLLDRIRQPKAAAMLSLALTALALLMQDAGPQWSIVLAGIGSAFYHVSGGMLCMQLLPGKASSIGLFAGPGVMGLTFGGYMSVMGWSALPVLPLLIAALTGLISLIRVSALVSPAQKAESEIELHDLVMILLLLGIAFRSAIWNVMHALAIGDQEMLILIAAMACAGKIAGGWLADAMGWRNYCLGAMAIALPLLAFGGYSAWAVLPGVFLLQSVTAPAIAGMHRAMPAHPGMATGLSVGLAIAAGGLPLHSGFRLAWLTSPEMILCWGAVAGIVFYSAFTRLRKVSRNPVKG